MDRNELRQHVVILEGESYERRLELKAALEKTGEKVKKDSYAFEKNLNSFKVCRFHCGHWEASIYKEHAFIFLEDFLNLLKPTIYDADAQAKGIPFQEPEMQFKDQVHVAHGFEKKVKSTGGSTSYYELPEDATQLQDLIEYRDMNANRKEVFKAAWRVGMKSGNSDIYEWNKIVYFGLREIGRITAQKDYLGISNEIIGDQSIDGHKEHFAKLSTKVLKALTSVPEALYEAQLLSIYEVLGERSADFVKRVKMPPPYGADLLRCPACGGTGSVARLFNNGSDIIGCTTCKGTGNAPDKCPHCYGLGEVPLMNDDFCVPCPHCKAGSGETS